MRLSLPILLGLYLLLVGSVEAQSTYSISSPLSGKSMNSASLKTKHRTSVASNDTLSCSRAFSYGMLLENDGRNQESYDTLRWEVETCPTYSHTWHVFGYLSGAVSGLRAPNTKWLEFRQWLFKVLYLNRDTNYYCADAAALVGTLNYDDPVRGYDTKGYITIEKYLVESGKCPGLKHDYDLAIANQRAGDIREWRDTVKDSLLTPYDSTLPTLEQIGFQILLGPEYAAQHSGEIPKSVLGGFTVSPNPASASTEVLLDLQVPATLSLDVYDELGVRVRTLVPNVFTLNGELRYPLDLQNLPGGTYYVRASVPEGEVKTLKVVKR